MTYSFGNVVRLDPKFKAFYNDLSSMTHTFVNRWATSGDEAHTNVPGILSYRQYTSDKNLKIGYNAYNFSDVRVAKGDFIRMKEISLAYDFPKTWFSNTPINNLSVKLQATNLFLLYADKKLNGQDPEFFNVGGVASPMPKQFTLTVKVGL
jgi:putative outer membrane protein, probably involved in nutrient binding